jgi:hypothetical protein
MYLSYDIKGLLSGSHFESLMYTFFSLSCSCSFSFPPLLLSQGILGNVLDVKDCKLFVLNRED